MIFVLLIVDFILFFFLLLLKRNLMAQQKRVTSKQNPERVTLLGSTPIAPPAFSQESVYPQPPRMNVQQQQRSPHVVVSMPNFHRCHFHPAIIATGFCPNFKIYKNILNNCVASFL